MSDVRVEGDVGVKTIIAPTVDGRVLVQFALLDHSGNLVVNADGSVQGRMVDHMKMDRETALAFAEAIIDTVRQVAAGMRIERAGVLDIDVYRGKPR